MTTVENKHPDYTYEAVKEWRIASDTYRGETYVKKAGELYLPRPSGYNIDRSQGDALYSAYLLRAQFPDILAPTISAMVGVIHEAKIEINLPEQLEYLTENATKDNLTLDSFHKSITKHLLAYGRYGVLADAPEQGGDPFLCGYDGSNVINWSDDNTFFVIDDSGLKRNRYDWNHESRHVVLELIDGFYTQTIISEGGDRLITPTATGAIALNRIPFVCGNAIEVSNNIHQPPLLGVARSALAIYQLSADYRWQLFMSGQETLVAINGEPPQVVGAGTVHHMEGSEGITPDLKYVSPSCKGIEAHRTAMLDNRENAIMSGAKFLRQESGNGNESGKSRKLRFSSDTASLSTVANVSCEMLERSLRNVAMLLGLSDEQQAEITVVAPKDFMASSLTPQEVTALVSGWVNQGYSYNTLYENLQKGGVASPDRTVEEELLLIDTNDDQAMLDQSVDDIQQSS